MRHGKKFNHLGRKAAHRNAMLSNMACSLIEHKRINTTVAKARELRKFVEPLITKAKNDTTHSRRIVFSYLKNKYVVTELFRDVAVKVADRPGGYTRIIKTGNRLGDNAEMCMIELVDYNEIYSNEKKEKKKATRRRGGSSKTEKPATEAKTTDAAVEEKVAKKPAAPKAEPKAEKKAEPAKAEKKAEEKPAKEVKAEAPAKEEKKEEPKAEAKSEKKDDAADSKEDKA